MNLLILSTFVIFCAVAVDCRYPYDDAYAPGDIVPHGLNSEYGYGRGRGKYPLKPGIGGIYGGTQGGRGGGYGGYGGGYDRRSRRFGRNRDVLHRDYERRRYGEYGTHLPPRGLGGYNRQGYDRSGFAYGRNRPEIVGPPKYYDYDDINYGGYNKITGIGIGLN